MIEVIGVGDNVVDHYVHTGVVYPGGNALNFAVYSRMLGVPSAYMGVFGDDANAAHVYKTAKKLGVDLSHCRFEKGENGCAKVKLENGDRVFLPSNKGGVSREKPLQLTGLDESYLRKFDLVHTSCYSYIESQLPAVRSSSAFVSMDFSDHSTEEYFRQCCPYIDFAAISCGDTPDEEIIEKMKRILGYGCRQMVLATRGARGALILAGGVLYEQSPCLVEAKDTMGAGDSFLTSFLISYMDGMKCARDFPNNSGRKGITTRKEYSDVLIRSSLYQAAIFSAATCGRDGSFGYGKEV